MSSSFFPTLGELVKYLFDVSGALPRKYSSKDIIDSESKKKTIQKKLQRLKNEERELEGNLKELLSLLEGLLFSVIKDGRSQLALRSMLQNLVAGYQQLVSTEGTYLSRSESIKWALKNRMLDRFVLSLNKYQMMNSEYYRKWSFPEGLWWLPDLSGDKIKWPMNTAYQWVYDEVGVNQTHFHFPDHGLIDDDRLAQNLQNIHRWVNEGRTPSWSSVEKNLTDSIRALADATREEHRVLINEEEKENFMFVLFFARISNEIFKTMLDSFGADYVEDIIGHITKQQLCINEGRGVLKRAIEQKISDIDDPYQCYRDRAYYITTMHYWNNLEKNVALELSELFANPRSEYLYQNVSVLAANIFAEAVKYSQSVYFDRTLIEMVNRGLKLKGGRLCTKENISDFETLLDEEGLKVKLSWLLDWITAAYYYHNEEDEKAFPLFLSAFEKAKYCAGKNQYKLVNQYVESCAKNGKWKEFKKGVAWANYLGIEIRWHRGCEETDEKLSFAYNLMKEKAMRYPVL